MKGVLDFQKPEIVNVFDEISLWSAPFGRLLLENIPMKKNAQVLDLGFGTGFPLVELAQRFGSGSTVYGMDIWPEAVKRTQNKIKIFDLDNVKIFEQSAEEIPLENGSLDLICSNLGLNNFNNKGEILLECYRVLKEGGNLCVCTNPIGTFKELFTLFNQTIEELQLEETKHTFEAYLEHRESKEKIIDDFSKMGFNLIREIGDETNMRFVDAEALLDHGLIRIGFLTTWLKIIPESYHEKFFNNLKLKINSIIQEESTFEMSIPILYLEFEKDKY